VKLYDYAASANCHKVRLLLAQLGPPYQRIPIDIFGGDTSVEAIGDAVAPRGTYEAVCEGHRAARKV
jgi:Glutathione S-transferase, N-terminal domain